MEEIIDYKEMFENQIKINQQQTMEIQKAYQKIERLEKTIKEQEREIVRLNYGRPPSGPC